MRVALVQTTSTDDVAANLASASALVEEAVERGAAFVALPENFAFLRREGAPIPCAQGLDGEIVGCLRALARRLRVRILGGTFPESVPNDTRVFNTSVLISPAGELEAVYRKIHLFDVDLAASGGGVYRESAFVAPGAEVVVAHTPDGHRRALGLLRPALSGALPRARRARGADARGSERLHARDRQGPLGGVAARASDREPGLRARAGAVRAPQRIPRQPRALADRRSLGPGAGAGRRPSLRRGGGLRFRASSRASAPAFPPWQHRRL